jgi:hypothetical protein
MVAGRTSPVTRQVAENVCQTTGRGTDSVKHLEKLRVVVASGARHLRTTM